MIQMLQNTKLETAKKIRSIFQRSYAVEAELLQAIDFPPLKRPLEDYMRPDREFFGRMKNGKLAGVAEIIETDVYVHIRSLVVDPKYFRQGIGKELVEFVLESFETERFVVETGVKNEPASKLYEKLGFTEVAQWDTDHGVRKVKFELKTT